MVIIRGVASKLVGFPAVLQKNGPNQGRRQKKFQEVGPTEKTNRKIAPLSLLLLPVLCMKIQGGATAPTCPPLSTPMISFLSNAYGFCHLRYFARDIEKTKLKLVFYG